MVLASRQATALPLPPYPCCLALPTCAIRWSLLPVYQRACCVNSTHRPQKTPKNHLHLQFRLRESVTVSVCVCVSVCVRVSVIIVVIVTAALMGSHVD